MKEKPQTADKWNRDKGVATTGKELGKDSRVFRIVREHTPHDYCQLSLNTGTSIAREIFEFLETAFGVYSHPLSHNDIRRVLTDGKAMFLKK